jgi:hypothetical protein
VPFVKRSARSAFFHDRGAPIRIAVAAVCGCSIGSSVVAFERVAREAPAPPQIPQRRGIGRCGRHDDFEQFAALRTAQHVIGDVGRCAARRLAASKTHGARRGEFNVHRVVSEKRKGHHLCADDGPLKLARSSLGYIIRSRPSA